MIRLPLSATISRDVVLLGLGCSAGGYVLLELLGDDQALRPTTISAAASAASASAEREPEQLRPVRDRSSA